MSGAVFAVAILVFVVAWFWLLVLAFRESAVWGVASFFFWPAMLFFVIKNWDKAKTPFLIAIGTAILAGITVPALEKKDQAAAQPQQQQQASAVTLTHPTFDPAPEPRPIRQPVAPKKYVPVEEPPQPVLEKVYADSSTKQYWTKDCAKHPDTAFLMAKSVVTRQGYKPAPCN